MSFNNLPSSKKVGNIIVFDEPYRCNIADWGIEHKDCVTLYNEVDPSDLVQDIIAYPVNKEYNFEIYKYKDSLTNFDNLRILTPVTGGSLSAYE